VSGISTCPSAAEWRARYLHVPLVVRSGFDRLDIRAAGTAIDDAADDILASV
jgi:hypothetical protein